MTYTFGDRLKPTAELLKHMPGRFHSGSRALFVAIDKHGDLMLVTQGRKKVEHYHPKFWTGEKE